MVFDRMVHDKLLTIGLCQLFTKRFVALCTTVEFRSVSPLSSIALGGYGSGVSDEWFDVLFASHHQLQDERSAISGENFA